MPHEAPGDDTHPLLTTLHSYSQLTALVPVMYTLGFMSCFLCTYRLESTSIARALARKNDYKIIYNREIIGLGVANFFGAAFNSYTTTGEHHMACAV